METHSTDHQIHLQFFDQHAVLCSDSTAYIDLFNRMYQRFLIEPNQMSSSNLIEFRVQTCSKSSSDIPVLVMDGQVFPLRHPSLMEGYVYDSILNTIISRISSHFLIHAGVVSKNDQGMILVADSGHGKTTLVLELVRRGFRFLSDEMAAIGRFDRLVHPFPRSLRIRPQTLDMTGFQKAGQNATMWYDKLLLDIDNIKPGCLGERVPIGNIVILQDPHHPDQEKAIKYGKKLSIQIDQINAPFLQRIRSMRAVRGVELDVDSDFPWIIIQTDQPDTILKKVELLCQEYNTFLLNYIRKKETRPKFDAAPILEPISTSRAALILLRRFLGGNQSSMLTEAFDNDSLQLFMALADLISHADCHRLFVGPLQDMADTISMLADNRGVEQ